LESGRKKNSFLEVDQAKTGQPGFPLPQIEEWIGPLHSSHRANRKNIYMDLLVWSADELIMIFAMFSLPWTHKKTTQAGFGSG
jgi:hypothetical protein